MVSAHGFLYSRFKESGYFDEIMQFSNQGWSQKNNAAELLVGEWTWFQTPANYALYNFRDFMVVLFILSITITAIYYIRNRNKQPDSGNHKNQELIF